MKALKFTRRRGLVFPAHLAGLAIDRVERSIAASSDEKRFARDRRDVRQSTACVEGPDELEREERDGYGRGEDDSTS
ncbi:MAG: hypothetical protein AABO58_16530 [Acidobacteriota bacterium]